MALIQKSARAIIVIVCAGAMFILSAVMRRY